MVFKLCFPRSSKPKSGEPEGSSCFFTRFIKSMCFKRSERQRIRYTEHCKTYMEKKVIKPRKLTLEDWLQSSPAGTKPDYLKRGEFNSCKNSRKKIHPSSSSQVSRGLISEAIDSLCLDRPMNNHKEEEGEEKSESVSVSGKAQKKRVSFKLPHVVILYSPEEEPCGYNDSSEDSFYSPMEGNCRGGSSESLEEIPFKLAVNLLPHVSVPSRL